MSMVFDEPSSDEPRPSLPSIHSLFAITKPDAHRVVGIASSNASFPGTLSSTPASRPSADFDTFSLSSASSDNRSSLSSIASKGSPSSDALAQPPTSTSNAQPPGGGGNSVEQHQPQRAWIARGSFSGESIDPLAPAPASTTIINGGGGGLVGTTRRSSDVVGSNGIQQPGGQGGAPTNSPFGWSSSSPSSRDPLSTAAQSTPNHHFLQSTPSSSPYGQRPGSSTSPSSTFLQQQQTPYHPQQQQHQQAHPPRSTDSPGFRPSSSSQRISSLSHVAPGSMGRMPSSSSTSVMRAPSPVRPFSAPWGGGNGAGSIAGFVREGGESGVGRENNLVFFNDDEGPTVDVSGRRFKEVPGRRVSENEAGSGGPRRASFVGGGGVGPDRSSSFAGHPSASSHSYHPYSVAPNAHHHLQQQQYQPAPLPIPVQQPLFHPHQVYAPAPPPSQQTLPFPSQPPFPNSNYSISPYPAQQGGYYAPLAQHPHQLQQQHQLIQPQTAAPPLHHPQNSHPNEWARRNSLPATHHSQRVQMMAPPPVPPSVWHRDGNQAMFVAAEGPGGHSGGEVMRRASDGDILTGSRSTGGAAKEAKYDCSFCGKRFNRPSSLKIHTYSHTGEKPFVCTHSQCGRKFSVQSNLKRHARTHFSASTVSSSHVGSDPSRPSSSTSAASGRSFDPEQDAEGDEE